MTEQRWEFGRPVDKAPSVSYNITTSNNTEQQVSPTEQKRIRQKVRDGGLLSNAEATVLLRTIVDYESAICFETSCTGCAELLDRLVSADEKFEAEHAAREAAEKRCEDAAEMNGSNCQRANRAEMHADGLRRERDALQATIERVRTVCALGSDHVAWVEDGTTEGQHAWVDRDALRAALDSQSPAEQEMKR